MKLTLREPQNYLIAAWFITTSPASRRGCSPGQAVFEATVGVSDHNICPLEMMATVSQVDEDWQVTAVFWVWKYQPGYFRGPKLTCSARKPVWNGST